MRRPRSEAAYTILELMFILGLSGTLMALSLSAWRGHTAQKQLRYGIIQLASDLRDAQERAKEGRVSYTVSFTKDSSAYVISGGTFQENATLPGQVVANSTTVVTFSPFGQPSQTYTITLQNNTGSGTVTVNSMGGIAYQTP